VPEYDGLAAQTVSAVIDATAVAALKVELQRLILNGTFPCVAVYASLNGKPFINYGCGFADLEKRSPLQQESIMRFFSMTKPITSVGIMQLVEQGKLKLDDCVSAHVTEWDDAAVRVYVSGGTDGEPMVTEPAARPMTVRHLLTHTAGLDYSFWGSPLSHSYQEQNLDLPCTLVAKTSPLLAPPADLGAWCKRLSTVPLLHHPGEKFVYSTSTDLLGLVLERVSGEPLAQYLTEHILNPLGMDDTAFRVREEHTAAGGSSRFTSCYDSAPDGQPSQYRSPAPRPPAVPAESPAFRPALHGVSLTGASSPWCSAGGGPARFERVPSGGGGIVSTMEDYHRFALMLARQGLGAAPAGGDVRILREETVHLMRVDQLGAAGGVASAVYNQTAGAGVAGSACAGRGGVQRTSMAAVFQGFGLGVSLVTHPHGSHLSAAAAAAAAADVAGQPVKSDILAGRPWLLGVGGGPSVPALFGGAFAGRGAGGWGGAAGTLFVSDPETGLVMVLATQMLGYARTAPAMRSELTTMVYRCCSELVRRHGAADDGAAGGSKAPAGFTG
jgi:CubicO group peptidase (beta-lactamase class C family)